MVHIFALVVSIFASSASTTDLGPVYYTKATWPTKEACEAFLASDEGKTSLEGLKEALKVQVGPDVVIKPECKEAPAGDK